MKVDLNCDLGESFGAYKIGNDEQVLEYITSANIACGFHAGDPNVMHRTVSLALEKNVALGAHIGFQDLMGFGRRNMDISLEEIYTITLYQIGALYGFVKAGGGRLHHVKPHGALYNMAAESREISKAIVKAVYKIDPALIFYGLSGSCMLEEASKIGLRTAHEVFADRRYTDAGTLTPRKEKNAVIQDAQEAIEQIMMMVKRGKVISASGKEINVQADTICIHGDTLHAAEFANKMKEQLTANGIVVQSI